MKTFCAVAMTAVCLTSTPVRAQRDSLPWVTHGDVLLGIAGVAATAAVAPFDVRISREFTEARWRQGSAFRRAADHVAVLGGSDPLVASSVLALVGTAADWPTLTGAAMHNIEAIALAGSVAGILRGFTGRALPNVTATEHFSFGRGFHDNNGPFVSFPSGHTAAAFAMAATISGEVERAAPALAPVAIPAAYAMATAVGLARVEQRVHWPTDLPLAMVIGVWSGKTVQAHAAGRGLWSRAIHGLTVTPISTGRTVVGWSALVGAGVGAGELTPRR